MKSDPLSRKEAVGRFRARANNLRNQAAEAYKSRFSGVGRMRRILLAVNHFVLGDPPGVVSVASAYERRADEIDNILDVLTDGDSWYE